MDDVTVNNATISIVKVNSTIDVSDVVLTYGESKEVTVTTTGATGITAKIDNGSVSVIDNYTIPISGLDAGNYTLTVTTIPDEDHNPATKTVNITVNKADTEITLTNETIYLKAGEEVSDLANLTPADAGNLTFQSSNEDIAIAFDGTIYARVKGNVTVTVSFEGTDNYAAAENKTITVYVTLKDASVSVENETLDLHVDDKYEFNPTVNPRFLAVYYSSSNESVVTVTDYGLVRAVGEGIAIITLTVGNDQTYAINTTNVTVTVTKVPTEISIANATADLKVLDEISSGATLTPADAGNLTYTSGNESVAIVKDGKIIAVGAGQAVITVSFAGDEKYAAAENKTITVTVNLNDASVSVNNSTLDLFVDDTFTVVATTVPDGLNVTFVPDDSGVYSVDDNGVVTALKEGTGNILVKVGGDCVYAENSTIVAVSVSKVSTEIKIASPTGELSVGAMGHVAAELNPSEAGNLTYDSNDTSVVTVSSTGVLKANKAGTALITVSFAGNDKYAAAEDKTVTITVNLNDASVSVNNSTLDLFVDDTFTVVATTSPAGLDVTFVPDDSGVYSVDDNGVVTALKEGTGNILVKVGGDGVYAENSTIVAVSVSKISTEIKIASPTGELSVGAMGHVAAELNPSEAGTLSYTSNDTTVVDVSSTGVLKANNAGTALITVSFAGNDKYAAAEDKTLTVTVSLKDASVSVNNSTLDLFVDDTFTVVATTSPDGLTVTFVPDNSGVVSVDNNGVVTALKEGTASIIVKVGGDGVYAENSAAVTVTVSKIPTEIVSSAVTTVYNDGKNLIVTLNDADGKPISGENITIDLNGAKTYTTDENGQVNVSTKGLAPKTYTAKITFSGNDKYNQSTKDVKVTVKKAASKITAKAKTFKTTTKTKKYTITLKNSKGKGIKNAKVTLKVNGKTYTAKTNSKGKATFKITKLTKKGTYKATVTFKGSKYYKKSTKKVKITVKSVFKTVSKGSKDKKTVKKIQRALKSNGYYLTYKGHYLKVDGKYGDCTVRSVKEFQNDKTLKVTGKVDEKTAKKLKII